MNDMKALIEEANNKFTPDHWNNLYDGIIIARNAGIAETTDPDLIAIEKENAQIATTFYKLIADGNTETAYEYWDRQIDNNIAEILYDDLFDDLAYFNTHVK
jgi:hypothetical protein